ncbi:MAG: hypothetical protein WC552_02525 [Candidatus Omnitrophota bacterium]
MKKQINWKKEWASVQEKLIQLGQETKKIFKEGEKEVVKLSRKGKLQLEMSSARLKKEHLFYLIGKEYVQARCPEQRTARLNKLLEELKKVSAEITRLNAKQKKIV